MSIWARIASVTNSASLNDSTAKPRLVELSEKRYGMSVDPSLTAMVMTSMPLPLAVFAAAVASVKCWWLNELFERLIDRVGGFRDKNGVIKP